MSKSSNAPVGRILISNDDGLDAIGIAILAEIAARLSDDVWVIAPTGNRSGMSRAITLHSDVIIEPRGDNRFACSGTPSDCVIMGMAKVMDRKPDLMLSGINAAHGERVIRHILEIGAAPRTIMNVNFPPVAPEDVRGIMPASLDRHKFGDQVIDGETPGSYRLGPLLAHDDTIPGSDRAVMDEGWISLTSLGMDITAETVQGGLQSVNF